MLLKYMLNELRKFRKKSAKTDRQALFSIRFSVKFKLN